MFCTERREFLIRLQHCKVPRTSTLQSSEHFVLESSSIRPLRRIKTCFMCNPRGCGMFSAVSPMFNQTFAKIWSKIRKFQYWIRHTKERSYVHFIGEGSPPTKGAFSGVLGVKTPNWGTNPAKSPHNRTAYVHPIFSNQITSSFSNDQCNNVNINYDRDEYFASQTLQLLRAFIGFSHSFTW